MGEIQRFIYEFKTNMIGIDTKPIIIGMCTGLIIGTVAGLCILFKMQHANDVTSIEQRGNHAYV